jgi:hypothetical protein
MSSAQVPAQKRQTVTFIPASVKAINELTGLTGLKDTDVINRGVQVYAVIAALLADGDALVIRHPDGSTERLHII